MSDAGDPPRTGPDPSSQAIPRTGWTPKGVQAEGRQGGDGPSDAERDALAAEYVLGTLEAWQSRAVERAMRTDPQLAAAVDAWEARLAPLVALAPEEMPPAGTWERIAAGIGARPGHAPPWTRRERLLRGWAAGASLAAAAFAALAWLRPVPEPRFMTVLVSDRSQAAWTAEVDPRGRLYLAAVPPVNGGAGGTVPEDRVMQLWALPPGATAPTSLGLLPREAGQVVVSELAVRPVPGMLIEITSEPPGGSPTGRPTGPVLFIGRLHRAGTPL